MKNSNPLANKSAVGFYRKHELVQILGISESTIWRMEKAGNFPKRKQLGIKSVGWDKAEIQDWIASREVA